MAYSDILAANFPFRRLKLAPEIKVMSVTADMSYPVTITNDNAPYALPYWHSQALARYILDNPAMFADRTILDIGCGCGAAAIAAAMVGARAIALDPDLRCLDFTARNARKNGVTVNLMWGDHRNVADADIILAGGVFHDAHGEDIAKVAAERPSLIAVSRCNLWGMAGFDEVASHSPAQSHIHVFKSKHLTERAKP